MSIENVTLKSSDGKEFVVEKAAAMLSETIGNMIEEGVAGGPIPLSNVTSHVLDLVISYCNKHSEPKAHDEDESDAEAAMARAKGLLDWDADFLRTVTADQNVLFDVIEAANYMCIKGLLDLTCKAVADMMAGKTVEQIRSTFHIVNSYTRAEEEKVRRENAWAFDM